MPQPIEDGGDLALLGDDVAVDERRAVDGPHVRSRFVRRMDVTADRNL